MGPTAELKTNTRLAEMIERLSPQATAADTVRCSALDARERLSLVVLPFMSLVL
jgi:hypothetical protein